MLRKSLIDDDDFIERIGLFDCVFFLSKLDCNLTVFPNIFQNCLLKRQLVVLKRMYIEKW